MLRIKTKMYEFDNRICLHKWTSSDLQHAVDIQIKILQRDCLLKCVIKEQILENILDLKNAYAPIRCSHRYRLVKCLKVKCCDYICLNMCFGSTKEPFH